MLAGDPAEARCITGGQESECRELLRSSVETSIKNRLLLNVRRTKETVVAFQRKTTATNTVKNMSGNAGAITGI